MNRIIKLRLLFAMICLILALANTYILYNQDKCSFDALKNNGQLAQTYSKYFSKKDAPWYYGTQIRLSYFTTIQGDTIRWTDKTSDELNFSTVDYIPAEEIIYYPKSPDNYKYINDFKARLNQSNQIAYLLIQTIFFTLFYFVGLGIIMIMFRRSNIVDFDYLRW